MVADFAVAGMVADFAVAGMVVDFVPAWYGGFLRCRVRNGSPVTGLLSWEEA